MMLGAVVFGKQDYVVNDRDPDTCGFAVSKIPSLTSDVGAVVLVQSAQYTLPVSNLW